MKRRKPYPYVHEFVDRHGTPRAYGRKRGLKSVALPWPVGSREFVEAYHAWLSSVPASVGKSRTRPGTVSALIIRYYASAEWSALSTQSQRTYRNILERFRAEHGDKIVADLRRNHVKAMIDAKASTPAAANAFRKLLRRLVHIGIEAGWLSDDPTASVRPIKSRSTGFRTWTEEDIAAFEARHPVGTKARLALALLLCTRQRRGDVVRMGRQHVRDGVLAIRQHKTDVEVEIPIHDHLQRCFSSAPNDLTFLLTEYGQPFTPAGFTNWFRDRCAEAGLPVGLSAHGLRKAMCRRLAEAGCTPHEIMSISGHKSLSEVQRYCEAASRKRLAAVAMQTITKGGTRTPNGKLDGRFAKIGE
jgi:integrase